MLTVLAKWRTFWLLSGLNLLLMCAGAWAQGNSFKLAEDADLPYVIAHCTACHSSALISQNRMTREGWLKTIRWMQKEQGLWPLGEHEERVLNYLERHYFPQTSGRRKPLAAHLMPETSPN